MHDGLIVWMTATAALTALVPLSRRERGARQRRWAGCPTYGILWEGRARRLPKALPGWKAAPTPREWVPDAMMLGSPSHGVRKCAGRSPCGIFDSATRHGPSNGYDNADRRDACRTKRRVRRPAYAASASSLRPFDRLRTFSRLRARAAWL